ncbi:hypothetical protein HY633_05625 [Candidatus Uhrbacteria bacterium]|nr:hypothetical protein [Candidatus Uhrbacteria bacterium]
MQSLNEVYSRIQEKKKERRDLTKSIKDALAGNARYQQITEELRKLKEEKKSIENQTMAGGEAEKMDLLKLDIDSNREMLADIAVNLLVANEKVEIVDEHNNRLVPSFSVSFKKDEEGSTVVPEARKPAFAEAV